MNKFKYFIATHLFEFVSAFMALSSILTYYFLVRDWVVAQFAIFIFNSALASYLILSSRPPNECADTKSAIWTVSRHIIVGLFLLVVLNQGWLALAKFYQVGATIYYYKKHDLLL